MENHKTESKAVKFLLIGISVLFLFVMLVLPLFVVVTEALKKGWQVYIEAVIDSYTIDALMLTLKATVIAVLCNTFFGLCAAWAVTRFQFKGKKVLTTLIDVPVTVSPIIAGLIYLRKTECFVPISATSRDTDCICGAGNYSGNSICNVSVCFPRTSSGAGIHRNR